MEVFNNFNFSEFVVENDKNELLKQINSVKLICSELDGIIENSFDGIYITDGDANTLKINKSYERITNLKKEELLGRNMREIVKDGIISNSGTLLAIENRKDVTMEQTFKNGKTVLISSNPVFDDKGKITMVVTNVRDITELIELTEKLAKNTEITKRYHSEIESIKYQSVSYSEIITNDKKMLNILKIAKKIAITDVTVLLFGETGVGKELVARFIYENSLRKDKYFFKVNCGAIPINLIESQLFGYEKGAFTGANKDGKMGIFETADGGTVLLDEIGELPLDIQVKFLRVLQENEITRVGGIKPIKVNVRILAATHRNLEEMIKKNLFREDLYYRLNVVPLTIPALRERKDDINLLINNFLNELNMKYGFNKSIDEKVLHILINYNWPGNIRELKNIIERIILMSNSDDIAIKDLPVEFEMAMHIPNVNYSGNGIDMNTLIETYEMNLINWAYKRCSNVRDAAEYLGIHPSTFVRKRQKYSNNQSMLHK